MEVVGLVAEDMMVGVVSILRSVRAVRAGGVVGGRDGGGGSGKSVAQRHRRAAT